MEKINQNSKEIVAHLVQMFKNESPEHPISMKTLYNYLSQLEFIVFMEYDVDGVNPDKIYFRRDEYVDKSVLKATLFIDSDVFDLWRKGTEVNYKVIDFDGIFTEILRYNDMDGNPCYASVLLNWGEDEDSIDHVYEILLNLDDVMSFMSYTLMHNAISQKNPYIVTMPNPGIINYDLLKALPDAFKKNTQITTAYYAQIHSPIHRDREDAIESHLPNQTYFTIVYDTEEEPGSYRDLEWCLSVQKMFENDIKRIYGVDLLMVHKLSEIGSLIEQTESNTIYIIH